jgi:phosphate transport system permease protein
MMASIKRLFGRLLGNLARVLDYLERPVQWLIYAFGWSSILCVLGIFVFLFLGAGSMLFELNWIEFFTSTHWHPKEDGANPPSYGALGMIVGNLAVAFLSMMMSLPLGLAAAVYISEFASPKQKESLKVGIETLAAIPSIVWGFIGVTIISPLLIRYTGATMGQNLLNGSLILALMSIPLVVSLAEDALRAVPDSFREAALALGASKWEIVYKVLFPAAKNGLLAACMLGVGRAVGETMAVLLATGNKNQIPTSLLDPISTLTATIASEMGDAEQGKPHAQVLFIIGIVLLVMTCSINLIATFVIRTKSVKA